MKVKPNYIYTTRLQKGGALLSEMRQLVVEWSDEPNCAERVLESNPLGSPTRARLRDVVVRTFIPRFVNSIPPAIWKPMALMERRNWVREALIPLHYYAAACSEPLMWDFVTDFLANRYANGHLEIETSDVVSFLARASENRFPKGRWSETVQLKVGRGLLAALRDFGLLSGRAKKEITPIFLPLEAFSFLALTRNVVGVRGRELLHDPVWRLFYLSDLSVERFFMEATQREFLNYQAAGDVIRVDFPTESLEEYVDALT